MTNAYEARLLAERIGRVTTGMTVTRDLRADLRQLAVECGMNDMNAQAATDNDLIGLCLVAQKNADAAVKMASKIQERIAGPAPPRSEPSPGLDEKTFTKLVGDMLAVAREYADNADVNLRGELQEYAQSMGGKNLAVLLQEIDAVRDDIPNQITAALKAIAPTRLNISLNTAPPTPLGLVHKKTPAIIKALAAGVNIYLHGPAGSGKTTVARKAAEAFGLQFYFAAKVESEYQLIGFTDAKGDAVRTPFREAYEHGGVFLFDEMDGSSPAAVVALNAALANGICPFPDRIVTRHKDFHVIGAGNTKLTGATRQYAGRNKLDAASIDRFAFIEFDYDDALESTLATDAQWCEFVQKVRRACKARGIDHLVTPRATYDGCKLLADGFTWDEVSDMCIFKGLDGDTVAQILEQVGSER